MQLIGLAGQDTIDSSLAFVNDLGVGDIDHLFDETGEIWARFGVASQPAWILVNDDGDIATQFGAIGTDGILDLLASLESA